MELSYLIMPKTEMSNELPFDLLPLINERNKKHGFSFTEGETWNDLYNKYDLHPNTGCGVFKTKNSIEYWYLPFESHPQMKIFTSLTVLDYDGIKNYGFDVEEI